MGRCYNDNYYTSLLQNDYAKVNKYILIATYYANKILELNIKENRENNSKKLTK